MPGTVAIRNPPELWRGRSELSGGTNSFDLAHPLRWVGVAAWSTMLRKILRRIGAQWEGFPGGGRCNSGVSAAHLIATDGVDSMEVQPDGQGLWDLPWDRLPAPD